jgi:hypothetical protein
MIEFEGDLTAALRNRVRPHHRFNVMLVSGLLLVNAGIIAFLFMPAPLDWRRHYFPVMVALIGGVLITRALAKPAELPDLHVRGSISDQRISWYMQDHDAHEPWSSFSGATVADDYIVLQRSAFFLLILAREFFRDAASWNEARAIVTRNVRIIPQQTPRRTLVSLLIWIAIFAVVLLISRYFTRPA